MKASSCFFCALASILLFLSPHSLVAQQPAGVASLDEQMTVLEDRIQSLERLSQHTPSANEQDLEALYYRRDERIFAILARIDTITQSLLTLPEDDATRADLTQRLTDNLQGAGKTVFELLDELNGRINKYSTLRDSLSGGPRFAIEAYVNSLRRLRFKYFEAITNVLDSRTGLGLPVDQFHDQLQNRLYQQAEIQVGRIEFGTAAAKELKQRLDLDAGNTELAATLNDFSTQRKIDLAGLESLVALMTRIDMDTREYRKLLVQQSTGVSVRLFDSAVFTETLHDAWSTLKKASVNNLPDMFFNLFIFFVILLLFRWLARLTRRLIRGGLERSSLDTSALLKNLLISVSGGAVMLLGILVALSQVGISLGPMLAGLGVAGFIVGFALQDTLGNFASGAMILIYRPYDVDDFVEVTGASGLVKKMNLVSTTIITFDNQTLVIPNSKIWGDVIKNVTAQKVRRVDLEVGIGYGDDIEHAERVLAGILADHDHVLEQPEARIKLHSLGDSSVNFIVRPWVKTEHYWDVYWDITREVKIRFDREGISIPFPQRDVHLYRDDS